LRVKQFSLKGLKDRLASSRSPALHKAQRAGASVAFCSQAESTPAHTQVTQTVRRQRQGD